MAFSPRETMRSIWRVLSRIAFWSYERGTWPYDVAVAAIVIFVLFSPRSWFHDQPAVGPPSAQTLVVLESSDGAGPTQTYSVDARLLASPIRTPELEHDLHDAMRKNTERLRGEGDTVVSYEVTISP